MSELPPEFTFQGYIRQKIVRVLKTVVVSMPGSGKTRPIIDALVELGRIYPPGPSLTPYGPIMIVCSGPAIATWLRQLPEWSDCPQLSDVIQVIGGKKMSKHKRVQTWEDAEDGIYIINFSIFLRDFGYLRQIKWAAIIADEYHKSMRRKKKNKTYAAFLSLSRRVEVVVLATGSFMRKNPSSMFTAFQIVAPKIFRGYWKFVNTFCIVINGPFGQEIGGVKNVKALQTIIDRYMAYVPKEVAAEELPEGRRQPAHAQMTPSQAKAYWELSEDMIAVLEDTVIVTPNTLTQLIRLRQLLCCPKILDESLGMGGGFELIVDKLQETPHMAIFVPFRPACVYIQEELLRRGHKHVYMVRGGIGHEEQKRAEDSFREHKGIMICTISYSESFDLETCDSSYFLGYDYSLDVNEQAEGRTQRVISEFEFVTWNYIKYLGTVDEHFLGELTIDMHNVRRVMSRPQALINALRGLDARSRQINKG